ncbi:membrane protein [Mesorhizobium sp. LNHC220B00]|nr:YkvA family protein [Mesorhizobium sp. LNHC220B00]ESY85931.1 membrane protein [Mesorhizobium sp. LNHC220B00]
MATLSALKSWARGIKRDIVALWLAARDPRVPWYAKAAAGAVAAYALSPIDLIPDFISIIGYLDDVVIVPIGILLAVRLVPPELMEEFRQEAIRRESRPKSLFGAAVIAAIWIGMAAFLIWLFWPTGTAATPA